MIADVALALVNGIVLSHRLERDPVRLERQLGQLRATSTALLRHFGLLRS